MIQSFFFSLESWVFYNVTLEALLSRGICKIFNNLQLLGSFHANPGLVLKPRIFSLSAFPSLGKNNPKVKCSGRGLRDKVAFMNCAWAEQSHKCEHVMIFNPKVMQTLYTLNY